MTSHKTESEDFLEKCKQGNIEYVRYQIENDGGKQLISTADSFGFTCLHRACQSGNLELVKYLYQLIITLQRDHHKKKCFQRLLPRLGSPESFTNVTLPAAISFDLQNNVTKLSPLHIACCYSRVNIVEYLIASNFDYNLRTTCGDSALHLACKYGSIPIAKMLLAKGVNINNQNYAGETPLHSCSAVGALHMVQFLHQHPLKANMFALTNDGSSALHYAAKHGRTEVCHYLVSEVKIPIDSITMRGETCAISAAKMFHMSTVISLANLGINLDKVDDCGRRVLHYAAKTRDDSALRELLGTYKQQPNLRDLFGYYPLHLCVLESRVKCVQALLDFGADPNIKLGDENTLELSLRNGNLQCFELLLQAGANPSSRIPLLIDLMRQPDACKLLIQHGADLGPVQAAPLSEEHPGWTPLHFACNYGYLRLAELLVEYGADLDAIDENGETAVHMLKESADGGIVSTQTFAYWTRSEGYETTQSKEEFIQRLQSISRVVNRNYILK